ncbi:MAG: tRNA 2-thiouridine(34) synthase MnmA [Nitrospirae bacterium]|nr:tRNA 2-thiouridine(34) synthase MnmA [Nitrospirota bacterium]
MSGGVDSSVAAFLLKQAGHDVTGLSFELWDQRCRTDSSICCSQESVLSARAVCEMLGIRHESVDVRPAFAELVIEPFCRSYAEGETPNPCVLCNRHIKFPALLNHARRIGADAVATGHYARIEFSGGRHRLFKGVDPVKDQSYFLYAMTDEELARTVFPLGGYTKAEVRRIAADAGLPSANRPESQDICFVGPDGYDGFIRNLLPEAAEPGQFVDMSGRVIGQHRGIAFHTVGQRRGLGVAAGERLYVVRIDRESNSITLGPRESGMVSRFSVCDLRWTSPVGGGETLRCAVKVRSTAREVFSTLATLADGESASVELDQPQWAPAPGQAAVFYTGDEVIGGGRIYAAWQAMRDNNKFSHCGPRPA